MRRYVIASHQRRRERTTCASLLNSVPERGQLTNYFFLSGCLESSRRHTARKTTPSVPRAPAGALLPRADDTDECLPCAGGIIRRVLFARGEKERQSEREKWIHKDHLMFSPGGGGCETTRKRARYSISFLAWSRARATHLNLL